MYCGALSRVNSEYGKLAFVQERNIQAATSHDVARLAGLSRSTVSQVLNGAPGFPPETRKRVFDAAAALDYRPSRAGRALKSGLDDLVIVLLHNITYGHDMQDTLDRISRAAQQAGMSTLVSFANEPGHSEETLRDIRPRIIVDLGVLTPAQRKALRAQGSRVLTAGEGQMETVDEFDRQIGRLQARELLRAGHRRLVYAGLEDVRRDILGPARAAGVDEVATERGLPLAFRVRVPLDEIAAAQSLEPYLAHGPVGVACYNDDVAIAVLAGARRASRVVPGEVSVVGVDNSRIGQLMSPRLTTVSVNLDEFVKSLENAIAGADAPMHSSDWSATVALVPGEST